MLFSSNRASAASTAADRRREPRQPTNETAELCIFEGTEPQSIGPVVLRDVSTSGACVVSQRRVMPGTTILLICSFGRAKGVVRHAGKGWENYVLGLELFEPLSATRNTDWSPLAGTW